MTSPLHLVCPHCDAVNRLPRARLADGGKCGRCRRRLFDGRPVAADGAQLERHIARNEIPVLVDFWAAWCGPCRMIAPEVDRLAKEYAGRVKVVKLNVDENQRTANQFQVRSIPTFILFRDGKVAQRQVGANPRILRDMMEQALVPAR